jgi:hypothetical protein
LLEAGTLDPMFGRRLPGFVEGLGVADLGYDAATVMGRGGNAMARLAQMTDALFRERFAAAGALTEADFDGRNRGYEDPSFWFVAWTLVGAWARPA